MNIWILLLLISLSWIAIEIGPGLAVHMLPERWFNPKRGMFRVRSWENQGHIYERVTHIRRWKGRLPEAGDWFAGGMRKQLGPGTNQQVLEKLLAETCRAELTHWLPVPLSLSFFIWNPPNIAIWMPLVALLGNAPFIMVQRFNRPRLLRVLDSTPDKPGDTTRKRPV